MRWIEDCGDAVDGIPEVLKCALGCFSRQSFEFGECVSIGLSLGSNTRETQVSNACD
jgi:hypothetical protein